MHVRVETMQMENLLHEIEGDIARNLELVNEDNYAGASGYARGSLISFQIRLKCWLDMQSHEDPWDYQEPPASSIVPARLTTEDEEELRQSSLLPRVSDIFVASV